MILPPRTTYTVRFWSRLLAWFYVLFCASAAGLCLYGIFDILRDGEGYAVLTLVVPALALFVFAGWSWVDTVSMRLVLTADAFEYSDRFRKAHIAYDSVISYRIYRPSPKSSRREIEVMTKGGMRFVVGNTLMNDRDELLEWMEKNFRQSL